MAKFCLIPSLAKTFKEAVDNGTINTDVLAKMPSDKRRDFIADYVGKENAKQVNASFESKLILKDIKAGLERWVNSLSNSTPKVKADLYTPIANISSILEKAATDSFLEDLAFTKLGFDVTEDEALEITRLSKNVSESKESVKNSILKNGYTKASEDERMNLGVNKVMFENYINKLKKSSTSLSLTDRLKPKNWGKTVSDILGATKGVVASLTSHAPLKHGFMSLFEDPKDWAKNYVSQFSDAFKSIKGENVMDSIRTEGYSRENSINGIYDKWIPGELSKSNEEYHSDIPSKIPIAGKLFNASKVMFDGFNLKMRMDLVDHYVNVVKKMGLDPNDPDTAKSWGKLAIDQTGGKSKSGSPLESQFLFSERLLRSQAQNLTAHLFDKDATPEVKAQAAKTLAKMVFGVAAVMVAANAMAPGSIELDPRSSNFGTIKLGNTRYDISGGMKGLVTLAARLATFSTKSSTSNKVSKLGSGTLQESFQTVLGDFLTGRASPVVQAFVDLGDGTTFSGQPVTVGSEISDLIEPIPLNTYQSLAPDPQANVIATMIAQQLGVMSTTYSSVSSEYPASVNKVLSRLSSKGFPANITPVEQSTEFTALKQEIPSDKYQEALSKYSTDLNNNLEQLVTSPDFTLLPISAPGDTLTKQKAIDNVKNETVKSVAYQYGYTPLKDKTPTVYETTP